MMNLSVKTKFCSLDASTLCSHAPAVNNTDRHLVLPALVLNATSEILQTKICSFIIAIQPTAFFSKDI